MKKETPSITVRWFQILVIVLLLIIATLLFLNLNNTKQLVFYQTYYYELNKNATLNHEERAKTCTSRGLIYVPSFQRFKEAVECCALDNLIVTQCREYYIG